MPLSNSPGAYEDCIEYLQKALDNPKGCRVQFPSEREAQYFQMRCQQARALERVEAKRIYEKDSPQWGKTDFDRLTVRRPVQDPDGLWWVYIERSSANVLTVEDL